MTVCYEFLFRKEKKRKEKIKYDIKFGNPCFILFSKAFFPAAIFTFDFWGCIGKAVIKI